MFVPILESWYVIVCLFLPGCGVEEPIECVPATCETIEYVCGTHEDGCGELLFCGECAAGETCEAGLCQPERVVDPCDEIVCDDPPADRCDGDTLVLHEDLGACVDTTGGPVCVHDATLVDCAASGMVCLEDGDSADCVDLCEGVVCPARESQCDGNTAIVFGGATGSCDSHTGQCTYPADDRTSRRCSSDEYCVELPGKVMCHATSAGSFAARGPYETIREPLGSTCTVFRPHPLLVDHPVVVWGNGTGGSPTTYASFLRHLASHGFLVAAADTANAGTGEEMIDCLDRALSHYSDHIDAGSIGTAGHSQGGGGAIMAGQDPRVGATAPMQPYQLGLGHDRSSQRRQRGPMFLMSGSRDSIAGPRLNQAPIFDRANVPVFWGTLQGAGHFVPTGDAGGYRGPTTAWFRYRLMGDPVAAGFFVGQSCLLCTSSQWEVRKKNHP